MMNPAYPFRLGQEEGRVSCFYPSNHLFFVGISGLMVELKEKSVFQFHESSLSNRDDVFLLESKKSTKGNEAITFTIPIPTPFSIPFP
jgi:hypothetical protein